MTKEETREALIDQCAAEMKAAMGDEFDKTIRAFAEQIVNVSEATKDATTEAIADWVSSLTSIDPASLAQQIRSEAWSSTDTSRIGEETNPNG